MWDLVIHGRREFSGLWDCSRLWDPEGSLGTGKNLDVFLWDEPKGFFAKSFSRGLGQIPEMGEGLGIPTVLGFFGIGEVNFHGNPWICLLPMRKEFGIFRLPLFPVPRGGWGGGAAR